MRIDPGSAALYALIAVCLVALGATLSGSTSEGFSLEARGTVLGGVVAVLAGVAFYGTRRRRRDGDDQEDSE